MYIYILVQITNDTGGIDIEICNILINLPLFLEDEDENKHVSISILICLTADIRIR